jgi:hypothetical protein
MSADESNGSSEDQYSNQNSQVTFHDRSNLLARAPCNVSFEFSYSIDFQITGGI